MAERIIVQIGDGSKLNSALKTWKQKSRFIVEELKRRKEFKKPSVQNREKSGGNYIQLTAEELRALLSNAKEILSEVQ